MFISQELALLHPEKVNRFVLYGIPCGGKENIQDQRMQKFYLILKTTTVVVSRTQKNFYLSSFHYHEFKHIIII